MNAWLSYQPEVIAVFLALALLTAFSNALWLRRFDQYPAAARLPRVSVLVPARNEEHNIEACLRSLLAQNYPNIEVIALNDSSEDCTRAILMRLAREDKRLRWLDGSPPPPGWLGKHWACHQLAQAASGELLLFTDADTRHSPDALRAAVSAMIAEEADMVTAFPREEAVTLGEKLIIPVIGWGILSFLPLALAQRLRLPGLSVSIGQFMLFRRPAFDAVGGYASVRDHVVDDVMLGRRMIAHGFRWRLMDGTRHVSCRMYRGFWEAVDGFTKNIFAFFDYSLLLFLVAWLWIGVVFLIPPYVVAAYLLGAPVEAYPYPLAALAVCESLLLWGMAYYRFNVPLTLALLYPLSMFLFVLIAFRSAAYSLSGQAYWKGRAVVSPFWRVRRGG